MKAVIRGKKRAEKQYRGVKENIMAWERILLPHHTPINYLQASIYLCGVYDEINDTMKSNKKAISHLFLYLNY